MALLQRCDEPAVLVSIRRFPPAQGVEPCGGTSENGLPNGETGEGFRPRDYFGRASSADTGSPLTAPNQPGWILSVMRVLSLKEGELEAAAAV